MPRTDRHARPGRAGSAGQPPELPPPAPVPLALRLATLGALAATTFAAFAGALRNGWVLLDDPGYVYENAVVVRGLTLPGMLRFLHEPHGANWVPLTAWSHMLDVQLFGLAPAGHHATSLLLHVLNALLLAVVLHRMTGAWWRSVLVAGLFALHPLRVESVAWIAERKDVLSTCFLLLTLGAYARWVERPGRVRFAVALAAFALGLMCKPMLVTLPFLLIVLDVWPLGRLLPRRSGTTHAAAPGARGAGAAARAPRRTLAGLVGEKWPYFLIAAVATAIGLAVQRQAGALDTMKVVSFERRACNALITCWRYVEMTAWPARLAAYHAFGRDEHAGRAVLAGAALLATTAVALVRARAQPWLATGWLWYVGTLVPVIGLVQTGTHAYADRFTYVPGIGLAVIVVWGIADLVRGSRAGRIAAAAAAVAVLAVLGVATSRQVAVWKDTEALSRRVLAVSGDNVVAMHWGHRFLGRSLYESGRIVEAAAQLAQAFGLAPGYEDSLRRVVAGNPGDTETRRTLAMTLAREARVEEAVEQYGMILARDPDDLDALNNVAWIRSTHELARHRNGAEAVRLAERARDHCPEPQAVIFSTLAAAYAEAGRFPDAVSAAERAVALARSGGESGEAEGYARQLALYRSGRPFHFSE